MSSLFIDMMGEKYGRLTCIAPGKSTRSSKYWICKCECGGTTEVSRTNLKQGSVRSCGCLWDESRKANGKKSFKHGHSIKHSRTYTTWECMRQRCLNPKEKWYRRYGGRGVTICKRWDDFATFLKDMGERPKGKTIDRINSDGNYEPFNCKWSTPKEQSDNIDRKKKISFENAEIIRGDNRTLSKIAADYGVGISTIHRIKHNLSHLQ